jgi:ribose 5-phosphate isomerase A
MGRPDMSDSDSPKLRAARAAADLVESGMAVGLGTGTTAVLMVQRLGERVREEGLRIIGVASSVATAELARSLGIPVRELDEVDTLDICLDGADEVDPRFRLIKGRGGALLREKLVASAARRRVTIIAADKRVRILGVQAPLPVEVSAVGVHHTERRLRGLGARTAIRSRPDGSPYFTDGSNAIIDCHFDPIEDPEGLDCRLQSVVGVFETGLFLGLCDVLVVGHSDRVELVESPGRPTA